MAKKLAKMAMVLVAVSGGSAAASGSAQSNMQVTATVTSTCTINAGSMTFGAYDPVAGSQVDGTATVTVACTKGATAVITLGQGANPTGASTDAAPERQMASGANRLQYTLYSDAGRSVGWGNNGATSVGYTSSSSASSVMTVFGRITSGQDVVAGSYADTVVATITF